MANDIDTVTPNRVNNDDNNNNGTRQFSLKTNTWPFSFSRILAATCCTLGFFNISRFSMLSIAFGGKFF